MSESRGAYAASEMGGGEELTHIARLSLHVPDDIFKYSRASFESSLCSFSWARPSDVED